VCIREVRHALDDSSAAPTFVETAHRRGYRFIGPVQAIQPATTALHAGTSQPGSTSDVPAGGLVREWVLWVHEVALDVDDEQRRPSGMDGEWLRVLAPDDRENEIMLRHDGPLPEHS
jgi:hypothetical protein